VKPQRAVCAVSRAFLDSLFCSRRCLRFSASRCSRVSAAPLACGADVGAAAPFLAAAAGGGAGGAATGSSPAASSASAPFFAPWRGAEASKRRCRRATLRQSPQKRPPVTAAHFADRHAEAPARWRRASPARGAAMRAPGVGQGAPSSQPAFWAACCCAGAARGRRGRARAACRGRRCAARAACGERLRRGRSLPRQPAGQATRALPLHAPVLDARPRRVSCAPQPPQLRARRASSPRAFRARSPRPPPLAPPPRALPARRRGDSFSAAAAARAARLAARCAHSSHLSTAAGAGSRSSCLRRPARAARRVDVDRGGGAARLRGPPAATGVPPAVGGHRTSLKPRFTRNGLDGGTA
jgi:hypothetical protein